MNTMIGCNDWPGRMWKVGSGTNAARAEMGRRTRSVADIYWLRARGLNVQGLRSCFEWQHPFTTASAQLIRGESGREQYTIEPPHEVARDPAWEGDTCPFTRARTKYRL